MTRRGLLKAFLPAALLQKPITTLEQPEAKAMDKHCPACGIRGGDPFRKTILAEPTRLTVVEEFLCQQCGCMFGYDKNDAGKQ